MVSVVLLWEWAVMPNAACAELALKLLLAQCRPMGVGEAVVAGGPPILADKTI